MNNKTRQTFVGIAFIVHLSYVIVLLLSGCNVLGIATRVLPPKTIKPQYTRLAGQTVGVMVWADRGIRADFPSIQLDLASALQNKLLAATDPDKGARELLKATFPVKPASIVRYQRDHPEIELSNITDVAPRLGVRRLIFVEIEDFSTRAPSVELFRGAASATIKVIEVNDGIGRVAFEENNVRAIWPPHVSSEGEPRGDDYKFYLGTLDAITTELAHRLVPYQQED